MALSNLRTWQSCAYHSEVHGHRNRGCPPCRESWTRNWPDTSYQVADDFASGALVRLLGEFEPLAWPVHLVVPTTRYMPRTVRAFLDVAAPTLSRLRAIHE